MNLTLIAAMASNNTIGKDNGLPWNLPDDLKRFKRLTSGHHIIMGRKTHESMGRALPQRTNIVVTRQKRYQAPDCLVVHTMEEALQKAENDSQPFVIGGAQIYAQALPYAKYIELTYIHQDIPGDTSFPPINSQEWSLTRSEKHEVDARHAYPFEYLTYEKL